MLHIYVGEVYYYKLKEEGTCYAVGRSSCWQGVMSETLKPGICFRNAGNSKQLYRPGLPTARRMGGVAAS